jgi:hypothetical protein
MSFVPHQGDRRTCSHKQAKRSELVCERRQKPEETESFYNRTAVSLSIYAFGFGNLKVSLAGPARTRENPEVLAASRKENGVGREFVGRSVAQLPLAKTESRRAIHNSTTLATFLVENWRGEATC